MSRFILLAIVVLLAAAMPAYALDIGGLFGKGNAPGQKNPYAVADEQGFLAVTAVQSMRPFNKPSLEFEIRLPANWEKQDFSNEPAPDLGQKILGGIGSFQSPLVGTSHIKVFIQARQLEHEISARNWLKNYILSSGYALQEDVVEESNRRALGSYNFVNETGVYYNHMAAQINGNLVVTARIEVPLALKNGMGLFIKRAIDSFRLIYPEEKSVEQQKVFTLVDAMKFNYPESWEANFPDFKDVNRLSVQIQNKNSAGSLEGHMRFLAVRRTPETSLKKEIALLKKYMEGDLSLQFKQMRSSVKAKISSGRFLFSRLEIYSVAQKDKNIAAQELHLAVLGDKEWYAFIFLLTPAENTDLYTWARNIQSFDLALKSVR